MKLFQLICLFCTFFFSFTAQANETPSTQIKPKIIFFDVNETLLDLEAMKTSVSQALGGRDDLLSLWFSTMLHHSLVESATQNHHTFGEVGVAALMMVAEINKIALSQDEAKKAIITPLRSLPPHPDVIAGLKKLKDQGYTLVSLTNSSLKGVQTQFKNAKLDPYFDKSLSVDDVKLYKPHTKTYEWAAQQMDIEVDEGLLVAAHGWDIAGAKAAGMHAIFIARPGKVLYPLAEKPDAIIKNLNELPDLLEKP